GAGLLQIPAGSNSRGLAEVGALPGVGPGYSAADDGLDTPGIAEAAANGELPALYFLHTDPLRDLPGRATRERALDRGSTVVAPRASLTEGVRDYATVISPTEPPASKEGTLTHADGRLQRMRQAIGHPGDTYAEWQVLAELAKKIGLDPQA